MMRLSPENRR